MKKIEMKSELSVSDLVHLVYKNIYAITYFVLVGLVGGVVYSSFFVSPEYTSSGTVALKNSTSSTVLSTITDIAQSTPVAELCEASLSADQVYLLNGNEISAEIVRAGVSASFEATSLIVSINFSYKEKDIVIPVLNALLEATVEYGNTNYPIINNGLMVSSIANSAKYTGQSKVAIILASALLGAFLGIFISLMSDLFGGRVLLISEIKSMGLPYFSLIEENNKKSFPDDFLQKQALGLQNAIENTFSTQPLGIIGFAPVEKSRDNERMIKLVAETYANNGFKTLVIDANMSEPFVDALFGVSDEINLSNIVESKIYQKPIYKKVGQSLFVLPAKKNTYPGRFIKSTNFSKLIEYAKNDFDIILICLTPITIDNSSLSAMPFLDCLIFQSRINKTKKTDLINAVNSFLEKDFTKMFICSYETKENALARILFHR